MLEYFAQGVLPVTIGAFLGAWFAFRLERHAKKKQERERFAQAGREAQFKLLIQRFFLRRLWSDYLESSASSSNGWRHLPVIFVQPPEELVNLDSLMFALQDNTTLLGQLLEGQQQFATVLGLLKSRNESCIEVGRRLAALESTGSAQGSEDELDQLIGRDAVEALRSLTEGLFQAVTLSIRATKEDFESLKDYLEDRFPKARFLSWEQKPARDQEAADRGTSQG